MGHTLNGLRLLETRQHIHHVDADLVDGVAALQHEQRRQRALADHAAVGAEIRGLQAEEADGIGREGIHAQRYDQRIGAARS
jgi:hypothetical protein